MIEITAFMRALNELYGGGRQSTDTSQARASHPQQSAEPIAKRASDQERGETRAPSYSVALPHAAQRHPLALYRSMSTGSRHRASEIARENELARHAHLNGL